LREPGSGTRRACDKHFSGISFEPQIRLELGSNEAIKEAVAVRLGSGVVSEHILSGSLAKAGVSVIDVKGFPIASCWHIVHLAGLTLSPVAEAFKSTLLSTRSNK